MAQLKEMVKSQETALSDEQEKAEKRIMASEATSETAMKKQAKATRLVMSMQNRVRDLFARKLDETRKELDEARRSGSVDRFVYTHVLNAEKLLQVEHPTCGINVCCKMSNQSNMSNKQIF